MKINQKYRLLQAFYWMIVCTGSGYTAYCLSDIGYTAGQIGLLTSAFGVCSAVTQPILGRIADRSRRFGWKELLMLLTFLSELIFLTLIFCRQKLVVGLLFGLGTLLLNCMNPLINAANYYYEKRGSSIDFGVARGMGSLSYALISVVMGQVTLLAGPVSVPAVSLIVMTLLISVVLRLPYEKNSGTPDSCPRTDERRAADAAEKKKGFFRRYPAYSIMLLGSMMLLTFHFLTNTYMIQMLRAAGGDSGNLGTAMAIAAVLEIPVMFSFTRIAKKVPSHILLVISAVSYVGKGILYLAGGSVTMIYFAQILQMTSYAIYAPAVVKFSHECMAEEDKVTGQACMSMTSALGGVIGNLCGGWLIDHAGIRSMLLFGTIFAAVGTAACILSAMMLRRQKSA